MKLIALCGPISSGKSTLAKYLEEQHNYISLPFSGPIKAMLYCLLRRQRVSDEDINRMLYGDLKETSTEFLNYNTPRLAMQTLGTEWGRNLIHYNLWVDIWERGLDSYSDSYKAVVDDLRFISEASRIRSLNGIIIRINRLEVSPLPDSLHQSEVEINRIKPDIILNNSNSKEDLYFALEHALGDKL